MTSHRVLKLVLCSLNGIPFKLLDQWDLVTTSYISSQRNMHTIVSTYINGSCCEQQYNVPLLLVDLPFSRPRLPIF